MLFVGEYRVVFTGAGRIVIPKKIRDALGSGQTFTLTKAFDRCLSGFRNEDWEKGTQELMGQSLLEMKKVEMKRHLFSSAALIDIDEQGRVVIPKNLLEYAGLSGKEVVIIGVGSYFELWEPERWTSYSKNVEENIKTFAKEQ